LILVASGVALGSCGGSKVAAGQISDGGPQGNCEFADSAPCTGGATPDLIRAVGSSGVIVHWPANSTCISVVVDPSLASSSDQIHQALSAWSSLPCGRLCFAEPVVASTPANAPFQCDHAIHFVPASGSGPADTTTIDVTTGHALSAVVQVAPAVSAAALAGLVGNVLGIQGQVHASSPYALQDIVDANAQPTTEAVTAYCALYGAAPICD
jgi:hypothetical protein